MPGFIDGNSYVLIKRSLKSYRLYRTSRVIFCGHRQTAQLVCWHFRFSASCFKFFRFTVLYKNVIVLHIGSCGFVQICGFCILEVLF